MYPGVSGGSFCQALRRLHIVHICCAALCCCTAAQLICLLTDSECLVTLHFSMYSLKIGALTAGALGFCQAVLLTYLR